MQVPTLMQMLVEGQIDGQKIKVCNQRSTGNSCSTIFFFFFFFFFLKEMQVVKGRG